MSSSGASVSFSVKAKNMKWTTVGLLLVMVVAIVLFAMIASQVRGVVRSNPAYQRVLSAVQDSPQVQEALGTPIKDGALGRVRLLNDEVYLDVPLSGPKSSGKLHYRATKSGDTWTVHEFNVLPNGASKMIELSK